MNICPTCHGKYKKSGTLKSHIRSHRNPDFRPNPKEVATTEELAAAGLAPAGEAVTAQKQALAKESNAMAGSDPVTQADLRIRDLETQVAGLTDQVATANTHRRLGEIINHAGEACTDCQQDLLAYNQTVIKSALEGLDAKAVLNLAVSKGVIAKTLTFQVA